MNLSFPASYLQAKLKRGAPASPRYDLDERACRRKAREPNGTSASPRAT